MRILFASAAAAAVLAAGSAGAATFTIDSFIAPASPGQSVADPGGGGPTSAPETAGPAASTFFGGARQLSAEVTSGAGPTSASINGLAQPMQLQVDNAGGTQGAVTLFYGAPGGVPLPVGLDITDGGLNDAFVVGTDFLDSTFDVTITVTSAGGLSSTLTSGIVGFIPESDPIVPLTFDFADLSGDAILSSVTSISVGFQATTAAANGIFDFIGTDDTDTPPPTGEVPLPASAFLLIGGLAGIGALRLRRRSS